MRLIANMMILNFLRQNMCLLITLRVWLLLIVVSLAVTACGDASNTDSPPKPTTGNTFEITIESTSEPTIFFPRQAFVAGEQAAMTALLIGELVVVDGCLRVNSREGSSYLVIWSPSVKLNIENNSIKILNEAGQVVARVGEEIRLSGGEVTSFEAPQETERLQGKLPNACRGPYWVVGNEIGPAE